MRIRIACLDDKLLWVVDDVIGGLYSIDLRTFSVECAIDCIKLFPYGRFEVLSLFKWKEEYIVIVPLETDKSWILYNKVTKEIGYRRVIERKCQEILITIDEDRNQLYFLPLYVHDPILIVDLNTLTCSKMIENWHHGVVDVCRKTAWKGAYNGQYIFFPIAGTKLLIRMNCKTQKVDILELDISNTIIDLDYAFGELWILPSVGNKLYQINENGLVLNISELTVDYTRDLLPGFVRIVVQKRYLFLFPYYRNGIYAYDKNRRKIHIISEVNLLSKEKNREINLQYWEYYIKDNQICFLPYRDKYMEVDLDTLAYNKKELTYPGIWSDKDKIWRIIWSHISENDSIVRENDECNLIIFLRHMQYKADRKESLKNKNTGEEAWNILKVKENS